MNGKKLYRTEGPFAKLCGVCGGIAEYFNLDPSIIRLAWIVFGCLGGAGIPAYIIAAIVIPRKSEAYPGT